MYNVDVGKERRKVRAKVSEGYVEKWSDSRVCQDCVHKLVNVPCMLCVSVCVSSAHFW